MNEPINEQRSREEHRRQQQHDDLALRGNFLETVVHAASMMNKVLMENCGLCTVYCDRQVNYEVNVEEWVQDQYRLSTASLGHLFNKMNPDNSTENVEVKQYQEFLFDEQSVLESVASRDGED